MNASGREGARWGSIALGLLVAILAGAMISPILRTLFGLAAEPLGERGDFTVAVVVFLVSGFLVYLLGGYVAASSPALAICSPTSSGGALELEDFLKEMDSSRPGLIGVEELADDREATRERWWRPRLLKRKGS